MGFSPCPVVISVALCKFLGWLSLVLCPRRTDAREFYHFISWGYTNTIPAHIYRNNGEPYSDTQVEQFIKDKLYPDSSNIMTDGDRNIVDFGERC